VTSKRLYRSTSDSPAGRHLAGVCGGIAEYLEIDPTLVRLAFVVLTLMGGPGVVIYIIMALVVPEAPSAKRKSKNEVYYEDVVRSEIPTPPENEEHDSDKPL